MIGTYSHPCSSDDGSCDTEGSVSRNHIGKRSPTMAAKKKAAKKATKKAAKKRK